MKILLCVNKEEKEIIEKQAEKLGITPEEYANKMMRAVLNWLDKITEI